MIVAFQYLLKWDYREISSRCKEWSMDALRVYILSLLSVKMLSETLLFNSGQSLIWTSECWGLTWTN